MNKIKVKQIFGNFTFYQEMVNYHPEGVEYLGVGKEVKKGKYYEDKKVKEKIGRLLQILKIPRMIPILPGDFDVIHTSRGIIPIQPFSNKPWIMDIEHVHSFFGLNPNLIKNLFWRKFIEWKLGKNDCKAILCHCEATRKSFFHYLKCDKFKDKIKVVYPAIHLTKIDKKLHKKIVILSVISIFKNKGGPQILEAFSRLEKKYKNVELWIKADVPKEYKKRYNSKNIKYFKYLTEIIPREELLKKIYSQADIFVYPSMSDSFGASLLDALMAKLPIITTNLYAIPEIVENKKNGFIVEIPNYSVEKDYCQSHPWKELNNKKEEIFIKDLIIKIEKLIKNKNLREKMGKESFKKINEGKFSIKVRNDKLKRIYFNAIK